MERVAISFPTTREHPFYLWLLDNMTITEAETFARGGWSGQEEHCLYVAALDKMSDKREKLKRQMIGRWYLSDDTTKEQE